MKESIFVLPWDTNFEDWKQKCNFDSQHISGGERKRLAGASQLDPYFLRVIESSSAPTWV